MKTGLTKQEKTTDIWFDEKDPLIHIRTLEIAKGRFSFRLTAPYSEERREAARKYARENNAADRLK